MLLFLEGMNNISIHALREEGDQPRRPKWTHGPIFLSTPSARRATAVRTACARLFCRISIHALREEGDVCVPLSLYARAHISIHALREEGDFHSIPLRYHSSISIHALREEGDSAAWAGSDASDISIHALREEGDVEISDKTVQVPISIHALREEGDGFPTGAGLPTIYFYPRPPRGGRRIQARGHGCSAKFLSTPSARRATRSHNGLYIIRKYFYPRPPRGGRRIPCSPVGSVPHFYPRPPRGGRR